jgi:hypothetical protein
MRRRPQAPSLAGLVGWVFGLVGFVVGSRPLSDNSLFTHLATGRLILDGGIPSVDPYSFTAAGEPWVVQSWLVSAVYGLVERGFGLAGVRVVAGLLVAALVMLAWHLSAPARALLVRVVLLGLVIGAGAAYWAPRPLLVGLVLLALVLVVVVDDAHDPRWLVPIMWVWVNAHGSFPFGVLVVGCLCLGRWLDGEGRAGQGRSGADPATLHRLLRPLGWVVIGTLAGAINPLGPRLLVFPLELLGRMEVLSRVVEWKSPTFDQLASRLFLVQLVVAILALVRRPTYRAAVPLVVFTAAALMGRRSIPDASLVMVPGMAVGLAGLGRLDGRERQPAFAAAGAVLAALAVLAAGQMLTGSSVDLRTYPVDALAWLDQRGALGPQSRVATEDTTGNFVELWRGGTRPPAFFDDRYDMYPLAMSRDYVAIHDGTSRWDEILAARDVDVLVWPRSSPLIDHVVSSPHWRIAYQDPTTAVACRRAADTGC